nr:hypothetical protein [Bacillaceae bacterium]
MEKPEQQKNPENAFRVRNPAFFYGNRHEETAGMAAIFSRPFAKTPALLRIYPKGFYRRYVHGD